MNSLQAKIFIQKIIHALVCVVFSSDVVFGLTLPAARCGLLLCHRCLACARFCVRVCACHVSRLGLKSSHVCVVSLGLHTAQRLARKDASQPVSVWRARMPVWVVVWTRAQVLGWTREPGLVPRSSGVSLLRRAFANGFMGVCACVCACVGGWVRVCGVTVGRVWLS